MGPPSTTMKQFDKHVKAKGLSKVKAIKGFKKGSPLAKPKQMASQMKRGM